jgi:ferredoxin-thioredoxin reductase catalytic subunit
MRGHGSGYLVSKENEMKERRKCHCVSKENERKERRKCHCLVEKPR